MKHTRFNYHNFNFKPIVSVKKLYDHYKLILRFVKITPTRYAVVIATA